MTSLPLDAYAQRTWKNPANKVFDFQNTGGAWSPDWWSPEGNTTLIFSGTGYGNYSGNITNNASDWANFGILFTNGMSNVVLVGNSINIQTNNAAGKIENQSGNTQTIAFSNVSAVNRAVEINPVTGSIIISNLNFYLGTNGGGDIRVWGNGGHTLSLNTAVSESGGIGIQQNSTVILQRTNTYTGQTFIHGGQLIISNSARAGTNAINLGGTNLAGNTATNALYLGTSGSSGGVTNANSININANGGASSLGGNNTSGINQFSGSITLNQGVTFRQAGGGTLIVSGVISGANAVTNAGSGTLVLSGNNTFSGAMAINAGVVRISHANALGTNTTGTTVASGAALELSNGITTAAEPLELSGTGIFSGGALRNVSGNNTFAGTITNTSAARINSDTGTLTLSGAINATNQELTFGGAGIVNVTGNITNSSAGVTKDGAGTASLRGTNTYTGTTTINEGVLQVTNGTAIADTAAVTLSNNAGATFLVSTNETIGSLRGGGASGGNVSLAGAAVLTVSESGSQTFGGLITNTGSLVKSGAGTMILTRANTFGGGATLSAGVLRVGDNASLGTGTFSLNGGTFASDGGTLRTITNVISLGGTNAQLGDATGAGPLTLSNVSLAQGSRTLTVSNNTTITGVISNGGASAGSLTKAGAGTLTIMTAASYTGATTVSAGELLYGINDALSDSTAVTVSGGTLNLNGRNDTVSSFTITSGTLGNVSGTLTAGSYALQGGNVNASLGAGGITVSAGTTALGSAGRLNTGSALTINSGQLTLGGAETVASLAGSGGTLAMGANAFSSGGANTSTSYSGVLTGTGGFTKTGSGTLTLSGNSTGFTGTTTISGGTLSVSAAGNLGSNPATAVTNQLILSGGTLAVTTGFTANANAGIRIDLGGGFFNVSASQTLIQGGGLYGTGGFVKTGQGTLSLTNTAGAFDGSVIVTNGTLQANTSLRGADISVGNSGTLNGSVLMGSGSVGTVTINTNGRISPGNSVGILSVSNTLNLNGGGSYLWEITNSTAGGAGTNWDLISVDTTAVNNGLGTVNIGATGTFTVNGLAIDSFTFDGAQSYTNNYFQIVRAGTVTGSTANLAFVSTNLGGGAWTFATNTNGIFLNYVAAGSTNVFTNTTAVDQGAANISGGNALGAFATITNSGGPTVVVISNTAALTFTNANNSYAGITLVERGTLVTTANSANAVNGAFGNASTAVQVGSTNTGSANAATLLIGAAGVDVGRAIAINTGGTGVRTVGATNSSGTATYSGSISMGTNVVLSASNASGTTLFSGTLSGAGAATIGGAGSVIFSGANDYTGATVVSNGATLRIANNTALGTTAAGTTIQSGGALALSNSITEDEAITLSGSGVSGSGGAIRSISGDNTLSGALTLGAASMINSDTGLLTLSGGINGANFGLTIGGTGNTMISGAITNSTGLLTKDGNGTLTLTGANTYSGGTLVSAGTLVGNTTGLQGVITNNSLVIFDQASDGTYVSVLSGTGALIKTNTGVLTLAGANTQSGGTTIGQGTLSIGSGGATGSLGGAITNNAILLYNRTGELTQATEISGTGALNKAGSGTLTLSQANTYTGATTISNGAIRISNASALGTEAAGTTVVSGAALELTGGITIASEALTLSGTGISSGGALRNISGNNTYGGGLTLGAASLINSDGGLLTLSGDINGANNNLTFLGAGNIAVSGAITNSSGALIKGGASTLTLSGNNTYTGATTISNGSTIIAASGNALGATDGATTVNDGGVLAFSNATGFNSDENINIAGTNVGALRNLGGANTNSGTITLLADGTIAVDAGSSLSLSNVSLTNANNRAVTVTGAGNSTLTGSVSSFAGSLTNNFIKDGSGTLTVNNNGTSGTAQLNIIGGTVTIAGGSLSTSTSTATRGIDLGVSTVNATTNNVALYANGGVTVSNSIYVAPNSNSATRTIGTESGSGTAAFNNEIYLDGNLSVSAAGGGTALFSGNLVNNGSITKIGAGTVILAGTNTAAGTVTVGSGTLAITNGNAIANNNAVAFSNIAGATLRVNQSEAVGAISGGGATGGTIDLATSQTLTTSFDSASSAYAGTLAGAGGLTKTGSGTLTLSGANGGYAGQIALVNGALLAGANNAFGTGTLQIDFGAGGTRALASSSSTSYTLSNSVNLFFNDLVIGQTSGGTGSLTIGGPGKTFFLGNDGGVNTRTITVNGSHTIAAQVTGDNRLAVSGGGTLALTGVNTFSGGSQLNNGTILVGNNAALGTGTLQFDFAGGTGTRTLASVDSSSYTLANNFNLFFNALTLGQTVGGTGSLTLGASTNTFNLGSDGSSTTRTVTVNGTQIIGAAVTGGANNNLNKAGSGTLVLAGDVSALGGTITNAAGRLQIGNGSTTGTIGNKNVTVASGAELAFNRSDNLSHSGIVAGTGGNLTQLGGGTLTLAGNNSFTGALTVANGTVSVGAANNLGNGTVTISNGGKLYTSAGFSASRAVTVGTGGGTIEVNTAGFTNTGGLNGTGNLVKSGLGTLSLTNTAGTYAGNITVTNGTLQANTTLRGANISVGNASTANGSVLMGSGSVGSVVINTNGQISPGNSVGTLAVSNALTFNGGGSYLWEITNTTAATPGVGWDLISVDTGSVGAGSLTIGSDGQFTVAGTAINGFSFDTTANYTNNYFLIVRAATINGSLGNLSFSSSGLGQAGNWSFSTGAEGLYLNYTAPTAGLVFTNPVVANQGDANLVTNNSAGAFATITDQGGVTSVTISNSAPLVFTNGANSYTGGTAIEQGTLVTIVNASNTGGAFGTNSGAISLGSTNGGNTNAASLLIGASGVDVSKGIDVNAGGTGVRTIGATNSSGVATYSGNVVMNTNVTLSASNSAGTTLFSGTVSGSGAVTIAGAGTVTLSGANSFTNSVGIASGATLVASNNSALGAGSGTTTVSNGATLALAGNINEDEAITIAGTGVGGNGALRNVSGSNTNTGTITLSANARINADTNSTLTIGTINLGNVTNQVTLGGNGAINLTGGITNTTTESKIVKDGSGSLVISNNGVTGDAQMRIAGGSVTLASGGFSSNTGTGTRALDIGIDAADNSVTNDTAFYANAGQTMSNSIYVAPAGAGGLGTRTIGTESTGGTATFNNQMFLGGDVRLTSAGTANLIYSGNISNSAAATHSVTKVGAGSLTLSASNNWRGSLVAGEGATILSGGNAVWDTNAVVVSNSATLVLGASETIGSLAGAGTVTLGANDLVTGGNNASTVFSGVIGGSAGGELFKTGTGTFTFAGVNTYSGDTIVNGGTLAFSNGSVNSSIIRLGPDNSAGNTTILLSDSDGGTTVSSTLVVQADAGSTRTLASSNSTGTNTYGGSIYLDGTATIAQQGAGVFALTGTEIDVKSRTLTLSAVTNGNIDVFATIFDSNADVGNIAKTGNGTVTLTGANAYAGTTLISAGTLQVGDGGASGQLGAGNVTNNASLVVNRTGAISFGNTISGTGSLTKLAAGTLTLAASNTFQGGSTLSGGALRVAHANALGTGAMVSSAGTTLEVTNSINVTNNLSVFNVNFLNGGNTLSGRITNNNTVYTVNTGETNNLSGYLTGEGSVTLIGGGVLNITGTTNDYTGNTVISNGTIRISTLTNTSTPGSLGVSNNITLAGTTTSTNLNASTTATIDYTGGNVTTDRAFVVNEGGGTINMATAATEMTLTGSASGSGKLIVGEGTLILSNGSTENSFAPGSIQVDSGATLQLAANNQIGNSTGLILNGGTFRVGTASIGFSDTLGTLTLSASSTIDLGAWTTGLRQLTFANSSAITWTGTLTITNWQGVALQSSSVAEILFGTGGLTSAQLGQVYWANQNINGGTLIGGELVPVPEPRVYAAAVALLAVVGWRERKRLREMLTKGLAKKSATPKA